MEIKDAFIQSITEFFPLFKMKPQFKYEAEEKLLSSADQVNVLNSFSQTLQGNIIFGFSKERALKIASLARGEMTEVFDKDAKNAIGEITTFIVNLAISKYKAINLINISPPVVISGNEVFLMISRAKTTKLVFQLDDDIFSMTYYIEQNSKVF